MPRASIVVAVAVFLAGLAAIVPRWLLDERDYLAVTPQPPAVESPTQLELTPGGRLCMNMVALDEHSEEARVGPVAGEGTIRLELTIRGEGGYQDRSRTVVDLRDGGIVALPVQPPPHSLIATLCLHNGSSDRALLAAVVDRRRSRSTVLQDGIPVPPGFAITFAEREPVSILERLPVSLERMSVLRPAVVSEVTLWPLLVLFVAGVPAIALWGFARAIRDDGDRAR